MREYGGVEKRDMNMGGEELAFLHGTKSAMKYDIGIKLSHCKIVCVQLGTNLGTKAEPQQIVAQRLLSCLQYLVPYLSRLQKI